MTAALLRRWKIYTDNILHTHIEKILHANASISIFSCVHVHIHTFLILFAKQGFWTIFYIDFPIVCERATFNVVGQQKFSAKFQNKDRSNCALFKIMKTLRFDNPSRCRLITLRSRVSCWMKANKPTMLIILTLWC